MSVSQKFSVRYVSAGARALLEVVGGGTVKLAPDCRRIEWSFEGLPKGVSPDIEILGTSPFPTVSRSATKVTMSGPAVGSAARAFSFRARAARGKSDAVPPSAPYYVVVPTPANHQDAAGDLVVVKMGLDANGQGTVDIEDVVRCDPDLRVRWDLRALRATKVGIQFTGPQGSDGLGPFTAVSGDLQALTGSGSNTAYGHYTYEIVAEVPGIRPGTSRRVALRIDPGIDNIPPPPPPPPKQPEERSAASSIAAALR